jgi:hypothetical protein
MVLGVVAAGCSSPNYGNIQRQTDADEPVSLKQLTDNWKDHDVFYATRYSSRPAAVMFDPKNDDKRLTGEGWYRIEDPVTLAKTIRIIQIWYSAATVGVVRSPDDRIFGYMYYPPGLNIPIKMVDENTLYVSTLPLPKSTP